MSGKDHIVGDFACVHYYPKGAPSITYQITYMPTNTRVFEAWDYGPYSSNEDYECYINKETREMHIGMVHTIDCNDKMIRVSHGLRFALVQPILENNVQHSSEVDQEFSKLRINVDVNKLTYMGTYESESYPAYVQLMKYAVPFE